MSMPQRLRSIFSGRLAAGHGLSIVSIKRLLPPGIRAALGRLRLHWRHWVLRDLQARDILRWRRDRGDQTLRLSYPLAASDVVLDLGGFVGDFTAAIHQKYGCTVYLFEPVGSFFAACQSRFAGNEHVHCFNHGLSASRQTLRISLDGDASSVERDTSGEQETIRLERFDEFLDRFNIQEVALLKINIEGGEFEVLEHLLDTGMIRRVRHLQVQFHDFAENAVARRERIRARLAQSHRQDWNYHFVWESWSRSSDHQQA